MSNTVLGILQIFPNKDDPDIKAVFNLKKGENFVGSSPYCEVIFPQNDIADVQCKISLDDGGEFFFSSVEEASGVYRTTPDGSLQKLKVNKEYELPINKAFYLGTKYKCLFIPKLGKSMPEPEARSPYKPYSTAYNGGNATKTQEMATLQIASLPYEMDELGYASQSQSDALSRAKPKLAGHLASLVHTADFRNSLDEYTQENGTMEDKSQNESEAGFGGLTVKTFRPKNSNRPSTDKDILPSLVPAYEDEDEFQRPEETPQKIVETKKTKSKQREEDEHVGLSLIARKGKNQLDEMSDEEEENEENEVEAEPASFRKGSKNNSPHDDMSILSSTRNTLARQDKEDSNDSTCIKSFKRKSEPGKVVGKMLGNMSSGNGRKSSEESEEEEPKEEAPDSGLVKHFKKKGNLMGTMLGLMKNKKGEQVKRMDTEDDDDDEVLRPDLSQDIGGKTIAQQKKEQEKKREEEQRRKEQEEQKRRELEKKKEEEQRRKEIERKKEEEARIARKKEEEKRAAAKRKEEEMKAAAKKKEEEMRAAAKKEEEEPVRGGRDSRKGQTKKEEDDSYKVKKEMKEEEDDEKGRKGRKTSGSATAKGNTKKEKEEPIMEIETKKEDDRRKKGVKRENSEEKDYDSAESLDGLPFRKLSKLREEEIREKEKQDEERTRRGRKKSDADEDEEYSAKKKVVGKRGKKSAEKDKETDSEKKKGKGGKKGKEEMEIEEDADDKKRKKRTTAGKKGKLEEGSLMDRLLKKQNEMVEMLRPYSDSDEDEEENPKYARGKKKTKESVKVKVKEEPKEVKKKGKVEAKVDEEEEEEEEKPRPKRGKKVVEEPKKVAKEPVERATRSNRSKGKTVEKPEKKIQEKNKKQIRDDEESEDEEEEEEEERVTRSTRRSKGKAAEKQEKKVQEKNKKQIRDDEESEDEEEDEEEEEEVNTRTRRSSRTAAKVETPKSNSKSKKDSPKKLTRTKSKEPLEDSDKGRKKVKTEAGSGAKDKKPVSQKSTAQKSKKKEVMEEETSDLDEINLPKRNSYRVIFSGFDPNDKKVDHAKKELDYLGVRVFEDKEKDFNVLVMEKFKRTIKFLLAVSRGVNIVSFKWVTDSLKEGEVLPPEDYVFTDKGAESKFKFRLSTTLQKAKSNKTPLMEDIRVWISPTIKPSHEELKLLVESLGGTVIKSRPTVRSGGVICLMNEEDTKTARQFSDMGLSVYSTELVYSAILQQKLNLHQNLVE